MGFVVPIRNLETHMPIDGVQLGDIGTKLGYNSVDNGWMIFNKVRIPRTNMLSRFFYIDQDGSIEIRGNPKAIYSTMVNIRSQLIFNSGYVINRALIIGVRYSVCRRQFSTLPGMQVERKILDY